MTTPIQNLTQWCITNGYPTEHDVLSHIHAGLRSAKQTKTYKRWYESEIIRLQGLVTKAKELYQEAVSNGAVIDPDESLSRKDKLIRQANGHPDNESVQAARRLLKNRYGVEII